MMHLTEVSNNFKSLHLSVKEVLKFKIPNFILRAMQVIKIITFSLHFVPEIFITITKQHFSQSFLKKNVLKVFSDNPTQWLQVERVLLNNNYFLQTTKSAGVSPWRT